MTAFRERGLVKARGQERTDSTHGRAALRRLNRLELAGETLRVTLDAWTACPLREHCTHAATAGRGLTLPSEPVSRALAGARARQETKAFATTYAARAGVEGSHSQAVRRCGARQCRYVGEAKTHLQHVLTAAAMNFVRVGVWLMGEPPARTRVPRFAQLGTVPS